MAEVRPFRGWKFNPEFRNISELTSPIFDLSDKSLLQKQYECPYNIIHLSLPGEIDKVSQRVNNWKEQNILVQDTLPAIYVYEQIFKSLNNEEKKLRGFIGNIRLHEWNEGIILRHESTMPHSVKERVQVMENTALNICPTHGLYSDVDCLIEKYLDESLNTPIYKFKDPLGVINSFSAITDEKIIRKFAEALKNKPIIIADGHHRYEAALEYRRHLKIDNFLDHPANFQPIFLTNTESNNLEIYPTHRLISDIPEFNSEEIIQKLSIYFSVDKIDNSYNLNTLITHPHSFGVILKDQSFLIRLKPGLEKEITWNFPDLIKDLDLTNLHYYIVEKILKINGKIQTNSKNINFSFNFDKAVSEVQSGIYQMAIITRPVSTEEIKKVCYSGYTLPHKSTYFFPKVLCGLVLSSLKIDEI